MLFLALNISANLHRESTAPGHVHGNINKCGRARISIENAWHVDEIMLLLSMR